MGEVTSLPFKKRDGLTPPAPLLRQHELSSFACGKAALDDWLQNLAHESEGKSARTFVVCDGARVIGYYCLANGSVMKEHIPKKMRFAMPDPVPVMIIGRLAVDQEYRGNGIGKGLMKDALLKIAHVSQHSGFRAVLVHAIDDEAVTFYLKYDFRPFPAGSKTMFLSTGTLERSLQA